MDFLHNIFNGIDILIISIILISCVVAAFRGFVKEIFSLLSWVFSIVIAFNFFDKFRIIISEYFTQKIIIDVVAFAVPFLTSLFVCHLITRWLSPRSSKKETSSTLRFSLWTLTLSFQDSETLPRLLLAFLSDLVFHLPPLLHIPS